jgi:hypothetical protein
MNVPNGPGTPKRPPIQTRGQVVEGKYQPTHKEASPREENMVGLSDLEGYEED